MFSRKLILYAMIYSLLGWIAEVLFFSVKNGKFENRGFINLPFNIPYGILSVILIITLPSLDKNYPAQYIVTLVAVFVVKSLTDFFIENIGKFETYEYIDEKSISNSIQYVSRIALAALCLLLYLMVHPLVAGFVMLMPAFAVKTAAIVYVVVIAADFVGTVYAMRTGNKEKSEELNEGNKERTQKIADRITGNIWKRLEKSYPGINGGRAKTGNYIFARGICPDKLIWVFLVSSFLGALIEMVYCYSIDGVWMNRSSLLYGPFSVVWGLGAVVLTISLRKFTAGTAKNTLKIFTAGFVIGGVYEYFCSVFTEIVFGTVFWDYSNMPFNLGGRTNAVYCLFWGVLAVVWTKAIYPPMSRQIERMPALWGKIITWCIVAVMLCNSLLTAAAMIRYTERQGKPYATNAAEEFLDSHFDNSFMEKRWPNMTIPQKQ